MIVYINSLIFLYIQNFVKARCTFCLSYNCFMDTKNLDDISALIANKEYETAQTYLVELLAEDEKNIEALKLLGLCNVNLGKFKEGRKNFETVVKFKQNDATSWFYLANCYDNLDDFLHAKTAYLEVIKLRENYLDAYKNLGVLYLKSGQPKDAFEIAKKAIEINKEDYVFHYMAGTALLALKDNKNCIGYLETALELNPNHSQILNNLGTAYLSTGNYSKAYEVYVKSSILDPKNSLTFHNIASILQIQNKHVEACEYFEQAYKIDKVETYLVSWALSEFKAGMFDKAINHYKKLVAQHPEKHNFQYNLACCYEMTGEYTFAIGILEQLTMLNPKSKGMAQKLANLYLKTNKLQKAKEIYERLISKGLISEEIYYEYALICVKTNNLDTAETILKKVIELNPDAAYARKDLGVIFLNKRLFDYAREEFEKAYEIAYENLDVIFEYANFLHATSDFTKAQELYQKAYEKSPQNPNILVFNSLNYFAQNNLTEALKYIELALRIVPDDAFILFTAGKINYALKNYEKAQLLLIKSWEINPTPEVENLLGLNYLEQNEFEKANNIFLKLSEKSPMNTNLLLNIARCYEKSGNKEKALEQVNRALEIFPEMEEAQEILKRLGS